MQSPNNNKKLILIVGGGLIIIAILTISIVIATKNPTTTEEDTSTPFRDEASGILVHPTAGDEQEFSQDTIDDAFSLIGFADVYSLMGQSDYDFFRKHLEKFYYSLDHTSTNRRISLKSDSLKKTGPTSATFTIYLYATKSHYNVNYSYTTGRVSYTYVDFYSDDKLIYSSKDNP